MRGYLVADLPMNLEVQFFALVVPDVFRQLCRVFVLWVPESQLVVVYSVLKDPSISPK